MSKEVKNTGGGGGVGCLSTLAFGTIIAGILWGIFDFTPKAAIGYGFALGLGIPIAFVVGLLIFACACFAFVGALKARG